MRRHAQENPFVRELKEANKHEQNCMELPSSVLRLLQGARRVFLLVSVSFIRVERSQVEHL